MIPLLGLHVFFPVSLIDQLQQQPLGTADQEASATCTMHYSMWCILHTPSWIFQFTVNIEWLLFIIQTVKFAYTPPTPNKSTCRVVLSRTILSLTKFIEKCTNIYDTKLVSLDTSWNIFSQCTYLVSHTLSYEVGQT